MIVNMAMNNGDRAFWLVFHPANGLSPIAQR